MEDTDFRENRRILEGVVSLNDNRSILKRIFLERTYTPEEVRAVLKSRGIEIKGTLEEFIKERRFLMEDPNDKSWSAYGEKYDLESLSPPEEYRDNPDFFKFYRQHNGNYGLVQLRGRREWRTSERPADQRIVKTKSLEEASKLMGRGFSLLAVGKKKVEGFTSCDDVGLPFHIAGYEHDFYVLVRDSPPKVLA